MFFMEEGASRERKQMALDSLEVFLRNKKDVKARDFIHIKLPLVSAHENHAVSNETIKQRRTSKKKQRQLEAAKLAAAQEEFREKLKMLEDFSVACTNADVIKQVNEHLEKVSNYIKEVPRDVINVNTQLDKVSNYMKDAVPSDPMMYNHHQELGVPYHNHQEDITKPVLSEPTKPPKPKAPRKRKKVQEPQKCMLYSFLIEFINICMTSSLFHTMVLRH